MLEIEWVDVEDPEARIVPTRSIAHDAGAAFFAEEGAWYAKGAVFRLHECGPLGADRSFASTSPSRR